MFTQQGALCTSSADTHPLTYAHAHERAISRHAPFHPMWAPHQRQPACISHHLSPRCSLFHLFSFFPFFFCWKAQAVGFLQGGFHSNGLITDTHTTTTTTHLNIQPIYSGFFVFSLLPGSAGSLLHLRKWLRAPFPCSENRGTTNHT